MTEEQWEEMAHKEVSCFYKRKLKLLLGELIGCGGSGAVYQLCQPGKEGWVIKLVDPESPIGKQELESLNTYSAHARFALGILKSYPERGIVKFGDLEFPCYTMQKGKSLQEVISQQEEWLEKPSEIIRLAAFLVKGIYSLKNMGLFHGDIKADNILLMKYKDTIYYMLADYGTVSNKRHGVRTIPYLCKGSEYRSDVEEGIAYDLHCLYLVLCQICGVEDDILPRRLDPQLHKILRIMRADGEFAFDRLEKLMFMLKMQKIDIPVSFYLDTIPQYELAEVFPFEKVMEWGEYTILRDKNAEPGEPFDPLLMIKIPAGRFDTVYKILVKHNKLHDFVMPIARYFDKNGNEYVLIHAPDDKNKCCCRDLDGDDERIQDDTAIPYTLELAKELDKKGKTRHILDILTDLKINIEFAPGDIWHLDGTWKLNLFSVDFLEFPEENTEKLCLIWK